MYFFRVFVSLLACSMWSCATNEQVTSVNEDELRQKAIKLAHETIITDGHVDLPYRLRIKHFRLEREFLGIPIQSNEGDFDYERAKKGGLDAPFMSIYIPADQQLKPDHGKLLADSLINMIHGITEAHPDKFQYAGSPEEVEKNSKEGKISLTMGM